MVYAVADGQDEAQTSWNQSLTQLLDDSLEEDDNLEDDHDDLEKVDNGCEGKLEKDDDNDLDSKMVEECDEEEDEGMENILKHYMSCKNASDFYWNGNCCITSETAVLRCQRTLLYLSVIT